MPKMDLQKVSFFLLYGSYNPDCCYGTEALRNFWFWAWITFIFWIEGNSGSVLMLHNMYNTAVKEQCLTSGLFSMLNCSEVSEQFAWV